MSFTVYVTRDFEHMSEVAAGLVADDIALRQAENKNPYVLGLATGNSPTGLYRHLAAAFNAGRLEPTQVVSFNLDEYVGLPGENAQQRTLHPESYSYFMIAKLFSLLDRPFHKTYVPWGTLIDQDALAEALDSGAEFDLLGSDKGRAIVVSPDASGYLGWVRDEILDAYAAEIARAGGIDLHVVGVGGRGHVAFHESGIPFDASPVLLVKLDDNTVADAVSDAHFERVEDSPQYAISMGAELVFQARRVVLVANGSRKTGPIAESILGEVTPDVPLSYGQEYAARGGDLAFVLDEVAAADLLERQEDVLKKGVVLVDLRAGKALP